jgi:hypothetical protein
MNALKAVRALRRKFEEVLTATRQARFFHDRLSVTLLVVALVVNGLDLIALAFKVRPTGIAVPTRYSNLGGGFDSLGPWYFPLEIGILAVLLTFANGWLAFHSFGRSRLASFFLLTGSGVVAFFSFIISMAFGAIK